MFAKLAILVSWPTQNTTSLPTAVIQSSSCGLAHDPVRAPKLPQEPTIARAAGVNCGALSTKQYLDTCLHYKVASATQFSLLHELSVSLLSQPMHHHFPSSLSSFF
ncbi:hypothetical protein F5Y07DRAFT_157235 [Xylaria sp. FL0933]|nr:hypothetical protein F5Y07DRAFT_157235 [Xylaria sp. FL0933]